MLERVNPGFESKLTVLTDWSLSCVDWSRSRYSDGEDEAWQVGEEQRVNEVKHLDKVRLNGKGRGVGKETMGIKLDNKCEVTLIKTFDTSCAFYICFIKQNVSLTLEIYSLV